MRNRVLATAMLMSVLTGAVPALPAQDRAGEIVCPTTAGTITLDGRLDDAPWAKAAETGPLVVIGSMRHPDRDSTTAKLVHDEKALYLAVTCEAAPAGPLPAQPRDDQGIRARDHVEIFLNPFPEKEDYYHLLVDRAGNVLDSWRTTLDVPGSKLAWNGDWQVRVGQIERGWTAEVRLPFSAFQIKGVKPGDLWRFKLGRDGGGNGMRMWPPNPTDSAHSRIADGALYFDTQNLLVNGDFETGNVVHGVPRPWEAILTADEVKNGPQGTVETIQGGLPPGGRALRLTKLDGRLPWSPIVNNGYKLEAGGTYEFSVMAKGTLPTFVLRASARQREQLPAKMARAFPVPADFASVAFRFLVPDATESVNIGIAAPAGTAGEVLIDQAVLRRLLNADETVTSNAPDYSPDPDPIHGLDALCERAGHKPWDLYWSKDHLLSYRVMFSDRRYGTWIWLLDKSPSIQYCETSSIWPGWNSDGSVLWVTGSRRTAKGSTARNWLFNADFSRLVPMPASGVPLWDLTNPDVYYAHKPGKLTKVNHRTGEQKVLATWEPRERERSYGLTKDNRSVFVTDHDGGLMVPYTPGETPLPFIPVNNGDVATAETGAGPVFRIQIGTRVYTDDGRLERVIVPISGCTEYLKTFASGRVKFPEDAKPPETKDLDELFQLSHFYPSCSHGHTSLSPDGEYVCWDKEPSYRVRDNAYTPVPKISLKGWNYHVCWGVDPRYYITCVSSYRSDYDRPDRSGQLTQVFSDGTWQAVCDIKPRPAGFYWQGNFATLSRDGTKIHYESAMTGVPKNYIAVMARPQPPRKLSWKEDGDAVLLSWTAPPHHREIKGYLVYRSLRSGDGYELQTPQAIAATGYRDTAAKPGGAYYYVVTSLEHCGLESGYSAEAARAGLRLAAKADAPAIVYAEAEHALVDLYTADKPGLSCGRDVLTASDWYYVYRTPQAKEGAAALELVLPADAAYSVWLRVRSGNGAQEPWTVGIDGEAVGTAVCPKPEWTWQRIDKRPVALTSGVHRLTLATAGAGSQADVVCLATDPAFVPSGVRPEERQAPAQVQGLQVAAGNDRTAHLTWQVSTEPDLDHYNVYAARQSFEKPDQCRLVASPTTPEFIDWGLASGETYHYAVTAVDRRGNESALSGRVDALVPARPYPPQQIELSFDQATVSGTVERLQAPGTHAKQYVMVPEKAAEAEVAAVSASWEVNIEHAGKHYFWLRYLPKGKASDRSAAVRQNITVLIDGTKITTLAGGMTDLSTPDSNVRPEFWTWARPIDFDVIGVELPAGKHTLTLKELTKAIRYDVLLITDEPAFRPKDGRLRQTF